MTEGEILTIGTYMLDLWLDRHWKLQLVDSIPCPTCKHASKDLAGHCSWDKRLIVLSRRYVLDMEPERLVRVIRHEIAHALTPEDWVHGEIFQAKLRALGDSAAVELVGGTAWL